MATISGPTAVVHMAEETDANQQNEPINREAIIQQIQEVAGQQIEQGCNATKQPLKTAAELAIGGQCGRPAGIAVRPIVNDAVEQGVEAAKLRTQQASDSCIQQTADLSDRSIALCTGQ